MSLENREVSNFDGALSEDILQEGLLVGRIWRPEPHCGPSVALFDEHGVHDISHLSPTMSGLLDRPDLIRQLRDMPRRRPVCSMQWLVEHSPSSGCAELENQLHFLAPCDLQVVKACGVTFAVSVLERVVEEKTRGSPEIAAEMRCVVSDLLGASEVCVKPGSGEAAELKRRLLSLNAWSQYLEVAFGPDAEVFTKAPPLAAVGYGAKVGIPRESSWNNPEPEVVLAVNSRAEIVGATLGNDVNLRDLEGRSALLLGQAKDFNGSCAIGPVIRLFDEFFTLDHVRAAQVTVEVEGVDGFRLKDSSSMSLISRDPTDLVRQTIGERHQYPDGLMLFLGTMFAPTQDRDSAHLGFTHKVGDVVTIRCPKLGALMNEVEYCHAIPQWRFGIGELFSNLSRRGLLSSK